MIHPNRKTLENRVETSRLWLRKPTMDDAEDWLEMRSDPQVMQFIPRPLATSIGDVQDLIKMILDFWEKGERFNWVIEEKASGKSIGMAGFVNISHEHKRAEIGYSLNRAYYRQGFMQEALLALIDFGFNQFNLHSIFAIVDEQNLPSLTILEKLGFRKEAHFLEDFLHNDEYRNSVHFGLLSREWKRQSDS